MNPHSALPQYRLATQQLADLSPKQQVLVLKLELWHALQRGNDFQNRARELELRVARLVQRPSEREAMLDAFARKLHADLVSKTREFEAIHRESEEKVGRYCFALRVAEKHCRLLESCLEDLRAVLQWSTQKLRAATDSEAPHAAQEIAS